MEGETGNALLGFPCKNGYVNAPQCYVIRTLPVLCFVELRSVQNMFESDLRPDDTSGNFLRNLGELSELNLLIDD